MVGAVGSAAPWFLTGWTHDVEVEFMIDTGFQVTILCRRPDCPVSAADLPATDVETQSLLVDQPFVSSEMGDSMDADLLPELS